MVNFKGKILGGNPTYLTYKCINRLRNGRHMIGGNIMIT